MNADIFDITFDTREHLHYVLSGLEGTIEADQDDDLPTGDDEALLARLDTWDEATTTFPADFRAHDVNEADYILDLLEGFIAD